MDGRRRKMKNKKAKAGSVDTLLLTILALASWPLAGGAHEQSIQPFQRGPQFSTTSEPVLLSLNIPTVEQVQLALRQRGYYRGEIDGFMGENTQIAIQIFYVDHCHQAAPVITRWLLAQLGIGSDGKSALSHRTLRQGQKPVPAID
jgi:peptidoglycan hydrolase-like protein with peptidoglycan-binding domain